MRLIPFLLFTLLCIGLIVVLDTKLVAPAPLGKLLAPQSGIWQNAEPVDEDFSGELSFDKLEGRATVYFDERLVPHVFAEHENDAYFIQGYLHARFRLWQMELQVMSAAGRASEFVGDIAINHDREFRRLGMVYAAESSLAEMEKDPVMKASMDAYTAGVNSYIASLTESSLPLEYKLLGYKPERWSNLKSSLFQKYISYDLAGHDNDFEMTNAKNFFSKEDFDLLYPAKQDSMDPIIPRGTTYSAPGIALKPPVDSGIVPQTILVQEAVKPDRDNGSNNWAVSGSRTASGYPILCNDPHLGLNLPSLWYEMQLSTPAFNAYGVTFPGAPGVVIGFNDSCAFGFTNGGRDVRDYYEIKFKDDSRQQYWFNNEWKNSTQRIERIRIAGKPDMLDTVIYTILGPVMYDKSFNGKRSGSDKNYAVRWKAHDPSNELKIFSLLDRASNYADYNAAVSYLHTPGQNCVFAAKNGDIALRTQGEFPAKWKGQGDFVMEGSDSTYLWQGMIPAVETPFQYNPERGYVSSANQKPTDSTYPYYLGRDYPTMRGMMINKLLNNMQGKITVEDMMAMQTNNHNLQAEMIRPVFLKYMNLGALNNAELKYFRMLEQWDLNNDLHSTGATVYELLWKNFRQLVFADEFKNAPVPVMMPQESTLMEAVLRDSAYKFLDDVSTSKKESIGDIVTLALQGAAKDLAKAESEGRLEWALYKDTRVNHLTKLPAFSRLHLPIGGGTNEINAAKAEHGPSWRMIVSLEPETKAYGVYPGGQNGNPGSRFYDDFVDQWAAGKYYSLWMMKKEQSGDSRIKWKMEFKKG